MKRLLKSLAWRFLPHAGLEAQSPSALRLPVRDKGAWGCLDEIFVQRTYEPFWPYLRDVRGWIDLGCNVGFFSLGLLDSLSAGVARRPATKALLADANRECLQTVRETLALNAIGPEWACEHVVVGPPGEVVTFNQFRYSVHSNVFPDQRGEKVFRYPATDLTALLQSRESLFDLIKIDIEGAEVFVFRHHADLLRRFRFGLCEWHAPQYSGRDLSESIDRLGGKVLEMRSHPKNYDLSRGPSWDSPLGTALWRMG